MNTANAVTDDTTRRTVLVTGATGGIGFATAAALARRGAQVIVHGRTEDKARLAAERLACEVPGAALETVAADLGSLEAVRALSARIIARFERLDAVIHNAGLERWERALSAEGHELTFAVNHLAPFLLTRLLTPLLARSAPARVIMVSSMVHQWGVIHWDDLMADRWYAPEPVYYQSKLASALTALELARRLESRGIAVLLAPPGLTRTDFGRDFRGAAAIWTRLMGRFVFRDASEAGGEFAEIALAERFAGVTAAYIDRLRVGHPAPTALAREDQRRMWDLSSALVELPSDEPPPQDGAPRGRPDVEMPSFPAWTRAVVLGELLGFTATVLVAWIGVTLAGGAPETVTGHAIATGVMTFAGMIEGASIGYFQWRALRRFLPLLEARAWMMPTILLASLGWLVGMVIPLVSMMTVEATAIAEGTTYAEPGILATYAFASVFGALIGALFGAAQWCVLRRHVAHAWRWIAGNTLGWALGLPATYVAGALIEADTGVPEIFAIATGAAVLMGLGVSVGTWWSMRTLRPHELP
mgnify:CR=1 FL=1